MLSNFSKQQQRFMMFCLLVLFVVGVSQSTFAQSDSIPTGQGIRVIVRLNTPVTMEPDLDVAAVAQQRQMIALAQDRVLQRVQTRASQPVVARKASILPIMGLTVDAAGLAQLQADPEVVAIMPDELYKLVATDPLTIVNAPGAWDIGFDGSGYAVAVLDTGVDFSHPAMAGKRVAEACFSDLTCPNGQYEQYGTGAAQPADCYDCKHGTHVAGIAAGYATDFSGVAPGAGIIAINVFTTFYNPYFCSYFGYSTPCVLSYTIDQLLALDYVYYLSAYYNIASVNLSLGGQRFSSPESCDYTESSTSETAFFLLFADLLRQENIPVIAASGNEGYKDGTMGRPACYSNVISVGASTRSDDVFSWSTSTDYLDLLAPGEAIYSSVPGGGYEIISGTSMAAPFVSGAWAIAREAYPTATVDEILDLMKDTGVDIRETGIYANKYYNFTTPRIDVYETVRYAIPPDFLLNMQELLAYLQEAASSTDLDVELVLQTGKALDAYVSVNGELGRVLFYVNSDDGLFQFSYDYIVSQSGGAASPEFVQAVRSQFPGVLTSALDSWLDEIMPGTHAETMLFVGNAIKVWKE